MKTTLRSRHQVAATAARPGGSRYFDDNGQLNASSRQDALAQMMDLFGAMSRGEVLANDDHTQQSSREAKAELHRELVEAFEDQSSQRFAEIGSILAERLVFTAEREGFMRNVLQRIELVNGQDPRIPVYMPDVMAFVATGPVQAEQTINKQQYIVPTEFDIRSHIFVAQRDIYRSSDDLLDRKFREGQEAIQVREDLTWKNMVDQTVGVYNELLYITGAFTPQFLAALTQQVNRWGLGTSRLLISGDVIGDIQASTEFSNWFDPVSKMEIILTGQIGSLLGTDIVTDNYRHPRLKVLEAGEIYAIGAPETHGAYTDRGPVQAFAYNGSEQESGIPGRGWNMFETLSMTIHNPMSVAKARKI